MNLRGPDHHDGRHALEQFVGELARAVIFSFWVAVPAVVIEMVARALQALQRLR